MVELERSRELLKDFGLGTAAELLDAHLGKAAHSEMTYSAFLCGLLETEEQARKRRSEETRLKLSRLPHRKALEEFDFSFQPSIDTRLMKELSTLAFAARKENVIFLGPPGVGKTHLAVGLAMKAIQAGMTVYYTELSKLIADLKKADEQNRLERRWRVYARPDILIVDEVGYLQLDRNSAELFFRLICERYETGSIILTSNKFFSDWGELMSDVPIATAILDRLLHHAYVINIRGESYRLKDRLKIGVQTVPLTNIPAAEHPA
jgi:DNA replication protein DnaC